MIVRIIGLMLLFIIHIRLLRRKSIAIIIGNRYGEAYAKKKPVGFKSAISNCRNVT